MILKGKVFQHHSFKKWISLFSLMVIFAQTIHMKEIKEETICKYSETIYWLRRKLIFWMKKGAIFP